MKHRLAVTAVVLTLLLAACAPRVAGQGPPTRKIVQVYAAPSSKVYPFIVGVISRAPGLRGSNGWTMTKIDPAGGIVAAQTLVRRSALEPSYEPIRSRQSVSVTVSPSGRDNTEVVARFTAGATPLVQRIHGQLRASFGNPLQSGSPASGN